jgi:hypothetical protein
MFYYKDNIYRRLLTQHLCFTVNTPRKSEIVRLHPTPHPPSNHSVHQQRQLQHQTPVEALTGGPNHTK